MADTIAVIGLDHHRTPVAVRERLAVSRDEHTDLARALATRCHAGETVLVSTCNRLECYLAGGDGDALIEALAERAGLARADLERSLYHHHDEAAARHLFRVAGGLESMVLGEDQIVHQVRTAYETARSASLTGTLLNPLFQHALACAKEVRSRTALGHHKMSISSVAVDLAKHIHGDLRAARLLILGAGEMAELAVRYLLEHGVTRIGLVNRANERAMALAELAGAIVFPWADLGSALAGHDIVVCSTSAPHTVVKAADVRAAQRRSRTPLVFIDLAVPRDVDVAVADLDDVYLYNIDHLEGVVAANRKLRVDEVAAATQVVEDALSAYLKERRPGAGRIALDMAQWFQVLAASEAERLAGRTTSDHHQEQRYALDRLANKVQHRLHAWLKAQPNREVAEQQLRDMLGL